MDLQPSAPPVVVVVVTTDPGEWFEECLASIADQDYPNLSVLVVDTASAIDPTSRVADVLPRAYVRRLPERVGFGRAANEVLEIVEGASHYLFCHDDVALEPGATRVLVEEAFRSNAGITSPKLVEWEAPNRLLAVGAGADRLGTVQALVEPGELDQEQHDAVRDVFVAPSAALLVRADLFSALDGFDPSIDQFGEDLDICWRSQLLGARVVVAPAARVRHLQAQVAGRRSGWEGPDAAQRARNLSDEHRLRTVLTCYGVVQLLWAVPMGAIHSLAEAVIHALRGRFAEAAGALSAPLRAVRRPGALLAARRRAQRERRVGDLDIRRLQSRGNTRLRALLRTMLNGHDAPLLADDEASALAETAGAANGSALAAPVLRVGRRAQLAAGSWRWPATLAGILLLVFLIGSRSLLGSAIPAVGHIPVTAGGPGRWWQLWWSPWRPEGLGSAAASPPALALLALAGTVLFGAVGTLQHVLVLGPLIAGPLGAWRAARQFGSRRAELAAVIVYAVIPLPYDAIARGRWEGLLTYAAMPWLLAALARATSELPFRADRSALALRSLRLGLLVALLGAFVPADLVVVPVLGAVIALATALTGRPRAALRPVVTAVASTGVAVVLLLPWSARTLISASALFGVGGGPAARLGLGTVLRFNTGPAGVGVLGWAFIAAAALPLLIGRSWRLAWAARCWAVALAFWGLTWAGMRGWLPFSVADPDVLLVPAAAAVALCAALGAAAFERDLPGYRFGWRQLASAGAVIAVAVAAIPVLGDAAGGRWNIPNADAASALALPSRNSGDYRVLWVGAPSALPLGSWRLSSGVGYATSVDGEPDLTDLWPPPNSGATPLIASDLRLAEARRTTTLGHLLAPLAVRYLVIPNHNAPSGSGAVAVPVPQALLDGLSLQTDMRLIKPDPNYTVYVNAAWAPEKALLAGPVPGLAGAGPAASAARQRSLLAAPLGGAHPALIGGDSYGAQRGVLSGKGLLYVASTHSNRWRLASGGKSAPAERAFGWAMAFPASSGPATLSANAPLAVHAEQILEVLAWLAAIGGLIVDRRRRKNMRQPVVETGGDGVVPLPDRRAVSIGAAGFAPEELWADG